VLEQLYGPQKEPTLEDFAPLVTPRTRSDEKYYPDVGGGFVEPHWRGGGIDWSEEYPYKGTETTIGRGRR
jgi:hypothetical protein